MSFAEQLTWSEGTPVLVVGYGRFPEESSSGLRHDALMAAAGRLREMWRPGHAMLMHEGPLALNLPQPIGATVAVVVGGEVPRTEPDRSAYAEKHWKQGVGYSHRDLHPKHKYWIPDEYGNYFYRVFRDVAGLVDKIPEQHRAGNWAARLAAMREIIAHVEWRHGSDHHGYELVCINRDTLEIEP